MKWMSFFLTVVVLCFTGCSKDNKHSYEYWSILVAEKYQQIRELTQSKPCSNIEEFEIVNKNGYYLVHPDVKSDFDRLMLELDKLQQELGRAAGREGVMYDLKAEPDPPLKAVCRDGKPTFIYAQDLTLSEVNAEQAVRYPQIQNFYADVPCTDPSAWRSMLIRTGCCFEGVAVHNTIRTAEFLEQVFIYSRLSERKLSLEKTKCEGGCAWSLKPASCVNGKPYVEFTQN